MVQLGKQLSGRVLPDLLTSLKIQDSVDANQAWGKRPDTESRF